MASITLPSRELYQDRKRTIRRLIAPLLPTLANIHVEQVGPGRDEYTLGVLPSRWQATPSGSPDLMLVTTRTKGLLLNYYETWKHIPSGDIYYLNRAYMHMHLDIRGRSMPQQVLSLHCDPALHQSEEHYRYKRGPHFHVEGADPKVDRAHISLCLTDQELGGADIHRLTSSLDAAIQMIVKEFVPCWERALRR